MNEDYDSAKLIKVEIEKLKKAATNQPPVVEVERVNKMPPIENPRRVPSQQINPRITVGQTMRFQSGGGLFEERKDTFHQEEQ